MKAKAMGLLPLLMGCILNLAYGDDAPFVGDDAYRTGTSCKDSGREGQQCVQHPLHQVLAGDGEVRAMQGQAGEYISLEPTEDEGASTVQEDAEEEIDEELGEGTEFFMPPATRKSLQQPVALRVKVPGELASLPH
jgi:hypothetical protein